MTDHQTEPKDDGAPGTTATGYLAATAARLELAVSLDDTAMATEVVFNREDAADTARAIREILARTASPPISATGGGEDAAVSQDSWRTEKASLEGASAAPEGWVLVPREPGTCENDGSGWLLALARELHPARVDRDHLPQSWSDFSDEQRERLQRAYRAMLAAAPSPPAVPDTDWLRKHVAIFSVEEDEDRLHLKVDRQHVATVKTDSPAGIALLKLDAAILASPPAASAEDKP